MEQDRRFVARVTAAVNEARRDLAERYGSDIAELEERATAEQVARAVLREVNEELLAANQPALSAAEIDAHVEAAIVDSFHGARLLGQWARFDDALNMTAIGTNRTRIELAGGRIIDGEPIADSFEAFRKEVLALRAQSNRPNADWNLRDYELELVLDDGTRVTAVWFVSKEPFVTLRRPTMAKVTFEDLVGLGTLDAEAAALLSAVVRSEGRVLVVGSMNVGKTTLLRALAQRLDRDASLITIESSAELLLDKHAGTLYPRHTHAMEGRKPNAKGEGGVSLNDLVQAAQRMNPTCVIVGELRGEEAVGWAKSAGQGYQVMATIHGRSATHGITNAALYLNEHTAVGADTALARVCDGVDVAVFLENVAGKRIVAQIIEVFDANDGQVRHKMLFDHDGWVADPDTDGALARRLEIHGQSDWRR